MSGKPVSTSLVYLITVAVAACSLIYELLIAQSISILSGNTVMWYALSVGLFLGGLGVGAYVADRFLKKGSSWKQLFIVEIFLSFFGALGPLIVSSGHVVSTFYFTQESAGIEVVLFVPAVIAITFIIGFLSGFEFPLLIRLANDSSAEGTVTNRVLAADYFGSLIGGLLFPIVLLPAFNIWALAGVVASINLAVAAFILFIALRGESGTFFRSVTVAAGAVCLSLLVVRSQSVEQFFLSRYYYYKEYPDTLLELFDGSWTAPKVERFRSAYQRIDIVPLDSGDFSDLFIDAYSKKFTRHPKFPWRYCLFINGELQLFSNFEEIYHEFFAHVPIVRMGKVPKKVLVMGAGDGQLVRELVKYKDLESVTVVEIDPVMTRIAQEHPVMRAMNGDAFSDPRVKILHGDAYRFVQESREKFDAIYLDFPFVSDFNLSRLYSREFYTRVRRLLAPGGFAALDADGTNHLGYPDDYGKQKVLPENTWEQYYSTIKAAGFQFVKPFFSNLEPDNPRAFAELSKNKKMMHIPPGATKEQIALAMHRLIRFHVFSQQFGFIMMHDGESEFPEQLGNPEIELLVLNQRRYKNAWKPILREPEEIDLNKVNSIFRPTLLDPTLLRLKLPFHSTG